ncbi:MAG: hypothetical protein ABFR47_05175 [Verrucomicrobiota bacterium]
MRPAPTIRCSDRAAEDHECHEDDQVCSRPTGDEESSQKRVDPRSAEREVGDHSEERNEEDREDPSGT